jgi:two-component system sensor histidine kinase BaeS
MKRLKRVPSGLGVKLFISHVLVALVGALTLLTAILVIVPVVYGNLADGTGDVVGSVSQLFGRTLLYSLLFAGLAAAVAAAVASLLVSRRIVDPLWYVLAATRRIASGRYGERVPVRQSDELGELSESFNAMARALEEAERRRMDVISDVSHELRTPLSTLQGYMEGLAEGVIEPSQVTWALLHEELERMRRLVDDLRQLSHAEAGQLTLMPAPVSPVEVVRLAVERMLPLFDEKGVELRIAVPKNLPPVLADGDRVAQVLTNLFDNALRHTLAGGRVVTQAEADGDEATLMVMDTGEGIAPEHLPHVFERFFRAEKSRSREGGGSGVGLAISKALVETMGGRIWAESPGPGKGATFSFTLPVSRRQS